MRTHRHLFATDGGRGIAKALQVRGSLVRWLCSGHTVRWLLRLVAADRGSVLTPGEIEQRYKLLLACGF